MIDGLKDNKTPWKWLLAAHKDALISAKKYGAMVFMDKNGYWQKHTGQESMGVVYRIQKDYIEPKAVPVVPKRFFHLGEDTQSHLTRTAINEIIDCLAYLMENKEGR